MLVVPLGFHYQIQVLRFAIALHHIAKVRVVFPRRRGDANARQFGKNLHSPVVALVHCGAFNRAVQRYLGFCVQGSFCRRWVCDGIKLFTHLAHSHLGQKVALGVCQPGLDAYLAQLVAQLVDDGVVHTVQTNIFECSQGTVFVLRDQRKFFGGHALQHRAHGGHRQLGALAQLPHKLAQRINRVRLHGVAGLCAARQIHFLCVLSAGHIQRQRPHVEIFGNRRHDVVNQERCVQFVLQYRLAVQLLPQVLELGELVSAWREHLHRALGFVLDAATAAEILVEVLQHPAGMRCGHACHLQALVLELVPPRCKLSFGPSQSGLA